MCRAQLQKWLPKVFIKQLAYVKASPAFLDAILDVEHKYNFCVVNSLEWLVIMEIFVVSSKRRLRCWPVEIWISQLRYVIVSTTVERRRTSATNLQMYRIGNWAITVKQDEGWCLCSCLHQGVLDWEERGTKMFDLLVRVVTTVLLCSCLCYVRPRASLLLAWACAYGVVGSRLESL